MNSAADDQHLAFTEHNKDALCTVVLIHGGFDNSSSWHNVKAYLHEYHLLIPDLPAHGRSRNAHPSFCLMKAADMVASMVRSRGKNGKARIVGLSLGAHVALQVITRHPHVVDNDALLTGYNIWAQLNSGVFASVGWFGARIGDLLPRSKQHQLARQDEDGFSHPPQGWEYWKDITRVTCTERWPQPWHARTFDHCCWR